MSSSWPTPTSDDESDVSGDVNRDYQSLASASASWPTPRAGVHGQTGNHSGRGAEDALEPVAQMWPTPDTGIRTGFNRSDSEGAANRPLLAEAAQMWATPSAADNLGGHASRGGDRSDELLLPGQAKAMMWATPAGRDYRSPNAKTYADRGGGAKGEQLPNQVAHSFPSSLPDGTSTRDGEPSSPSTPASRQRLNPAFVEWLMNFPPGWTDLDLRFSATELCRWWQDTRFLLSQLGWLIDGE